MKLKKYSQFIIVFVIVQAIILVSCKKENNSDISLFYGSWKTSYGDTIVFSRTDNKNILRYNVSLNPVLPAKTTIEYTYKNDKLGIKNDWNGPNTFQFFQSFRWIQKGEIFEIQGVEWLPFLSSTQVYFTFTKIP